MQSKLIETANEKTHVLIFQSGDEVMSNLLDFARKNKLRGARFTAIGAFSDAMLGYFEWDRKDYKRIPIAEQVEVLSLIGDVALKDGEPQIHAHLVAGKSNGTAIGGHLIAAHVRPTLEVMLTESPNQLVREFDQDSGIALIKLRG
jgi:predicted DNA-binding protein with PD1-like motif